MENEFIQTLKCDICGRPLTDTNHIGVVSANEVLCMHCFREGDENNFGKIVELNALTYSLKHQLSNAEKNQKEEYNRGFHWGQQSVKNNYKDKFSELLEEYYILALKSESATAIELIKGLKEKINDIK